MNEILDNAAYSVEERLEIAKEIIKLKQTQIDQLTKKLDDAHTAHGWEQDQNSIHRMGT
jgi:NAD+--asparagine ADP-ribosyltransferase